MGPRDIYNALALTAIFTILSEYLFNEESKMCIVPEKYRVLHKLIDINCDNTISDTEVMAAVAVLEKSNKEKQKKKQNELFSNFNFEKYNYDNNYNNK
jgi:hypothetical protein